MEYLEELLSLVANAAILIFEFIGVGIIIYSGLTGFLRFVRRAPDTKIYLAKGLAMGLSLRWEVRSCVPWWCASGRRSGSWPASLPCVPR